MRTNRCEPPKVNTGDAHKVGGAAILGGAALTTLPPGRGAEAKSASRLSAANVPQQYAAQVSKVPAAPKMGLPPGAIRLHRAPPVTTGSHCSADHAGLRVRRRLPRPADLGEAGHPVGGPPAQPPTSPRPVRPTVTRSARVFEQGRDMPEQATITARTMLDPMRGGQATDPSADLPSVCIRVDVLGGLRVRAGGRTLGPREMGGTKPRHLLLALLLNRGAPVSKDRLVSLLWGGSAPHSAKATLEAYVCVLRKALRPCPASRDSLITTVAGGYAIDMGCVDLDVVRYERLMSAALHPGTSATDALPMLQQAMALAESPLLPEEFGSEWLDEVRFIHDQDVRKGLVAGADKVAGLSCRSAERWARLALEEDPLDESAWHALLQNLEASGHHADGLQAYDQCRKVFAAELGCAPGPGLQQLYVRLLRGANEDDEGLSLLLDAVVRLHMACQVGVHLPITALASRRGDAIGQTESIEQAYRTLSRLLHRVGGAAIKSLGLF
jgi:DNA-binding SARP family transcriptional activator